MPSRKKTVISGQAQRPAPTIFFKYLSQLNINSINIISRKMGGG